MEGPFEQGGLLETLGLRAGHVTDSTVYYALYPEPGTDLLELAARCREQLAPHLNGYLWQRDCFSLHSSAQETPPWLLQRKAKRRDPDSGSDAAAAADAAEPPCLWGALRYGDCVDDAWFVVWLALQLTAQQPGLAARVWDDDGEFLLIEAAYALPRWLKPETAANRVWLAGGRVHIVPQPSPRRPDLPAFPSVDQAVKIVRAEGVDTHNPRVERPILQRVAGYPAAAQESMHTAHALLPVKAAHLLALQPQLVSAAVEAFHYRDKEETRAAAKMRQFPPQQMVLAAVRMNRCMAAQLASSSIAAPRGYPLPPPPAPEHKAADLGLKLVTGLEIVAHNGRSQQAASDAAEQAAVAAVFGGRGGAQQPKRSPGRLATDLASNPAWVAYRASLEGSGFFKGNIEGSAEHSRLLGQALEAFTRSDLGASSTAVLAAPAAQLAALLAASPPPATAAEFQAAAGPLPPADDDSWIVAGQEQLERELAAREAEAAEYEAAKAARRARRRPPGAPAAPAASAELDAAELVGRLRSFVNFTSGIEGAEAPPGLDAGGEGVALDAAGFLAELQQALGLDPAAAPASSPRAAAAFSRIVNGGATDSDDYSSSEEGSSFYGEDSSGSGSDDDDDVGGAAWRRAGGSGQPDQRGRSEGATGGSKQAAAMAEAAAAAFASRHDGGGFDWDAAAASDSDDASPAPSVRDLSLDGSSPGSASGFMEAYGEALERELGGTAMADSFERAGPQQQASGPAASSSGAAAAANGAATLPAGLTPLDVDMNLVKSMVESYGAQAGLAGPAGNLAALLGLELPVEPGGRGPGPS